MDCRSRLDEVWQCMASVVGAKREGSSGSGSEQSVSYSSMSQYGAARSANHDEPVRSAYDSSAVSMSV